jgi:hypothetical protein
MIDNKFWGVLSRDHPGILTTCGSQILTARFQISYLFICNPAKFPVIIVDVDYYII